MGVGFIHTKMLSRIPCVVWSLVAMGTLWGALEGQKLLRKIEVEEGMKQKLSLPLPLLLAPRRGTCPSQGMLSRAVGSPH